MVVCPDCGLARAMVPTAPSKLTIVGSVQQITPCPFCIFRADVVENLQRAELVIRELQGMAEPQIVEAGAELTDAEKALMRLRFSPDELAAAAAYDPKAELKRKAGA